MKYNQSFKLLNNLIRLFSLPFGLDCEWVNTTNGFEVIEISIFNYNFSKTWKIKPKYQVIDYLSHITGYDDSSVYGNQTKKVVLSEIRTIIFRNDFIIGHSLNNDFDVLQLKHEHVIDVRILYNHPDGPPSFYKLKDLSKRFLKREIQQSKHSSLEDAKTAFDLFLFSVNHGYIKPTWIKMDHNIESFVPDLEFILKACQTHQTNIAAVYLRGSRAIETNNEKSDYDYIVVQYNLKQLSGSLIRYGNVDMEVHDVSNFKSLIQNNIIWALEAIYCPTKFIIYEAFDFR